MKPIRLHLTLPGALRDEPVIAELARRPEIRLNIGRAHIEEDSGWVIVDMEGSDAAVAEAQEWLAARGVKVERIGEAAD